MDVLSTVLPLADATPDAVAELQSAKLEAVLAYARAHVPAYAAAGRSLAELPPTDKATLMEGLPGTTSYTQATLEALRGHVPADERLDAVRPFAGRSYVLRTSGTSGYVGFFLWDPEMAAVAEASATRFVPAPSDLPKPVVAVAPVVLWHPLRGPLEGLWSIPFGTGLSGTVEQLHEIRPRAIVGSTGFVTALAEEQIAGRLAIEPEVVVAGAEASTDVQLRRIRRAWGVEPELQYGLSEAGLVASRCRLGNYHVHEDTVILELLDGAGRPVATGKPAARALLTRLFGPDQPLLRYELGDVLVRGPERCPCGAPFATIAAIRGRTRALLWLRSAGGKPLAVNASAVVAVLELVEGLVRFQLVYETPSLLEIELVMDGPLEEDRLRTEVEQALRAAGAEPPTIRFLPGRLPDRWISPPGSKEHYARIAVLPADMG